MQNLKKKFPFFYIEVTQDRMLIQNTMEVHLSFSRGLPMYSVQQGSRLNEQEGGKKINRIIITICNNASGLKMGQFTDGWMPHQDKEDYSLNNAEVYFVEFMDQTNTGWISYCDFFDEVLDKAWLQGNTFDGDEIFRMLENNPEFRRELRKNAAMQEAKSRNCSAISKNIASRTR